jgi:hypothetical protein
MRRGQVGPPGALGVVESAQHLLASVFPDSGEHRTNSLPHLLGDALLPAHLTVTFGPQIGQDRGDQVDVLVGEAD